MKMVTAHGSTPAAAAYLYARRAASHQPLQPAHEPGHRRPGPRLEHTPACIRSHRARGGRRGYARARVLALRVIRIMPAALGLLLAHDVLRQERASARLPAQGGVPGSAHILRGRAPPHKW